LLVLATAEGVAGITAGATLLAGLGLAGVTIYTTSRRLSAETDRQKRELDARSEGQKRQLDHARELADLTDLRLLLDEFAVALDRGRSARDDMVLLAQTARHIRSTLEQKVKEKADPAKEIGLQLLALTMRLQVRLGGNDSIAVAAQGTATAMHAMWQQVELLDMQQDFAASLELIGRAADDFTRSSTAFIEAAVRRAGTVRFEGASP
jgi:hypothetical protein